MDKENINKYQKYKNSIKNGVIKIMTNIQA